MTPSPRNRMNPEWANLPRRRCDDCGKSYKPKRPLRPDFDQYGFCSPTCKKSFHKHGGAYRKLKDEMRKMVEKRFDQMGGLREIVREIVIEEINKRTPARPGVVGCPFCLGFGTIAEHGTGKRIPCDCTGNHR